jgi:hypothetical protein
MDIHKYIDYFHDGSLFAINHIGNKIEFSMASAEMDQDDLVDDAILSRDNSIQGKLHVEGVKIIKIDSQIFYNKVDLLYDRGRILDFELGKNSVEFGINWINFPPKDQIKEFNVIEVEADKVWWENIPNLDNYS